MIFSSCRADKYLLEPLKPADSDNILIVLGDRKETILEAYKAVLSRTPIVHIHGGEQTTGSYDNQFRNAITKMANLHFVVDENARKRVIQMGEHPDTVFNVGSIGAELAKRCPKQKKDNSILINYQPETLEEDIEYNFLKIIIDCDINYGIYGYKYNIFLSNNDRGSKIINKHIKSLNTNVNILKEVSMLEYHKLISRADICIGNSSSFIYEAPVLGTPVKLIGTRQLGREVKNYYKPNTIKNIIKIIKNFKFNIRKEFNDVQFKY